MEGITKEGIAKSAEVIIEEPQVEKPFASIGGLPEVPPDIYRFFSLHYGEGDTDTQEMLKDISDWAINESETMGDALMKLRNLEIELGIPVGGQTRYGKIFNWVTLQKSIDELYKKQKALT